MIFLFIFYFLVLCNNTSFFLYFEGIVELLLLAPHPTRLLIPLISSSSILSTHNKHKALLFGVCDAFLLMDAPFAVASLLMFFFSNIINIDAKILNSLLLGIDKENIDRPQLTFHSAGGCRRCHRHILYYC